MTRYKQRDEYVAFDPELFPEEFQQRLASYYLTIKECTDTFIKKGYGKEVMGVPGSQEEFNKLNLYHYLAVYLLFASMDIDMDIANGIIKTTEEYIALYKLDCIRKNLACTGCNPDNAMGVFDLSRYGQGNLAGAKLSYCGTLGQLISYFRC